jgi:hypothetical protein
MPFAQRLIEFAPMLAWRYGTLVFVGIILGGVLTVYCVYWIIFKMGKD